MLFDPAKVAGAITHTVALSLLSFPSASSATNIHGLRHLAQQKPLIHSDTSDFDWADLKPRRQLVYTPCYDGFQCARLSVPLNWNGSHEEQIAHRAALAIVKLPARVPPTHRAYGGVILVNPGGPGESGVSMAVTTGKSMQAIASSGSDPSTLGEDSTAKYFDLIGFDPRGVKDTTPHLKCFPDGVAQQAWQASLSDYGVLWESDGTISLEWARAETLGRSCAAGDDNIISFTNTAQTATDLIGIAEAHGQWREAEVERLLAQQTGRATSQSDAARSRESAKWTMGKEMVQYWGNSYGSLLGQTFAAMYPERVQRLIIDGVVSPYDYYNGTWFESLNDSDKVMTKLTEYCYEAGPENCPLHSLGSAKDIEKWIENFVFGLQETPLSVPGTANGTLGPEVITYGDLIIQSGGAMAFPFPLAERFFQLVSELSKGNTTAFVAQKQSRQSGVKLSRRCRKDGPYSDACVSDSHFGLLGPTQSIECMDSSSQAPGRNFTKNDFKDYYQRLLSQSKWFASIWGRHRMACVGLGDEIRPAWTFDGPISGNTSHPLLVISNSHDTVTPIKNGRQATRLFPGSAMIHQDSEGHCSHAMPSLCTGQHIRRYFQTGELPNNGTICQPEYKPFIGCVRKDKDGNCARRSEEEEQLWKALWGLITVWD